MKPYYEQSGITIYHGDCREILPRLTCASLLLTDPPYGIDFAGQPTKWQRRAGQTAEDWDKKPTPDWLLTWARSMARFQIIWGGNYFALPPARCWLSWFKADAPPSMGNVEYAWTNLDQNSRQIAVSIGATNGERVGHPTQKPEAVMAFAIQQITFPRESGLILDPFMGSGTTLVAAKRLGHQAIGVELEEKYCEIAAKRLQQEALPLEVA
jgi:site-specific DNA-methyltransferase (adenine-specific)